MPQAGDFVVPKFEWLMGLKLADSPVKKWVVTPDHRMARVEEEGGKVRWFLDMRLDGVPVEVRTI